MKYTLTKEKELNNDSKMILVGDSITGNVQNESLIVGQSLCVANMSHWRITSPIVKIEDDGKKGYIIETLNSIYTLKPV